MINKEQINTFGVRFTLKFKKKTSMIINWQLSNALPEITAHIHLLDKQRTSNVQRMTFIILTFITKFSTQMVTENGYIMTRTDKNWQCEINVYINLSEFFAEANVEAFQSTVQVQRIEFWDKL